MLVDLKNRIWGVDVSHWQDYADTEKKPDMAKLAAMGCRFVVARSTDGYVVNGKPRIDRLFWYYIEESLKYGMKVANYAYMNYLSQAWLGLTPAQWGVIQGETVAELVRRQWMRTFMDVETAPGQTTVESMWGTVMTILDNEVRTIDQITNIRTGLYTSTGHLKNYPALYRDKPLFAANYNDVSEQYVKNLVAAAGFSKLRIIQANNLGDINGDKIPDGHDLGMENPKVDIDLFIGDEAQFQKFFTGTEIGDTFQPYRVRVLISNLIIRSEPIQADQYDTGKRAVLGAVYDITDEMSGFGRIPTGEWIYVANPLYVERLADEQPVISDTEKLTKLWEAHPELHGG